MAIIDVKCTPSTARRGETEEFELVAKDAEFSDPSRVTFYIYDNGFQRDYDIFSTITRTVPIEAETKSTIKIVFSARVSDNAALNPKRYISIGGEFPYMSADPVLDIIG